MRLRLPGLLFSVVFILCASNAWAQTPSQTPAQTPSPTQTTPPRKSLERELLINLLRDQRDIWTSPLHIKAHDAWYLAPIGGAAAALIATDENSSGALRDPHDSSGIAVSNNISKIGGVYGIAGAIGGIYLFGLATHNDRARETGILTAEGAVDGLIVFSVLKQMSRRPRPMVGDQEGHFFTGGNSFPSGHATVSFTVATIIAKEYRKHRWVQITAYGVATAVGVARFTGRAHFLSDVLIGSAIGYGIGSHVFNAHHDPALDVNVDVPDRSKLSKLMPQLAPSFNPVYKAYALSARWNF
jgi:membrane-associated phospholipid phosphatase